MPWTTFREMISGCDRDTAGESIVGETHAIPVSSPYEIRLEAIPKVKSTATSVFSNLYVSLAEMATAGISLTIDGNPAVLTDSSTPAVGEVYFQLIEGGERMFSTKLSFNAADVGLAVVVNYTGFASQVDAHWRETVKDAVTRLETYAPCSLLSLNTYSGGEFCNAVSDGTGIVILGSPGKLKFSTGSYSWATSVESLSAVGDMQVSAFTDVDGWKRIGIYLIDNSGTVEARITEGAESATQIGLASVITYGAEAVYCGYVDVQGDSTGAAGGIEDIPQGQCISQPVTILSSSLQGGGTQYFKFQAYGNPLALVGLTLDQAQYPVSAGRILNIYLCCDDMGTAGNDLVIDVKVSGVSLFAVAGDKPVLVAGAGNFQRNTTPAVDLLDTAFTAADYLTAHVNTAPDDAEHVTLIVEVLLT